MLDRLSRYSIPLRSKLLHPHKEPVVVILFWYPQTQNQDSPCGLLLHLQSIVAMLPAILAVQGGKKMNLKDSALISAGIEPVFFIVVDILWI